MWREAEGVQERGQEKRRREAIDECQYKKEDRRREEAVERRHSLKRWEQRGEAEKYQTIRSERATNANTRKLTRETNRVEKTWHDERCISRGIVKSFIIQNFILY